jgi:hypothetical protein
VLMISGRDLGHRLSSIRPSRLGVRFKIEGSLDQILDKLYCERSSLVMEKE